MKNKDQSTESGRGHARTAPTAAQISTRATSRGPCGTAVPYTCRGLLSANRDYSAGSSAVDCADLSWATVDCVDGVSESSGRITGNRPTTFTLCRGCRGAAVVGFALALVFTSFSTIAATMGTQTAAELGLTGARTERVTLKRITT